MIPCQKEPDGFTALKMRPNDNLIKCRRNVVNKPLSHRHQKYSFITNLEDIKQNLE